MKNQIFNCLFLFLVTLLTIEVSCVNDADAGVLFRNKYQVIRTYQPSFRRQQYNVRLSTAVLKATNPKLNYSGGDFGGVSSQIKLITARNKYDEKLNKWETKRDQLIAKKVEKERQMAKRDAQRKAREADRLKRKREREAKKIQSSSQSNNPQMVSNASSNPSSRGSLGASSTSNQPNVKKKGFWSSLLQAFFGRSNNTAP